MNNTVQSQRHLLTSSTQSLHMPHLEISDVRGYPQCDRVDFLHENYGSLNYQYDQVAVPHRNG